MLVLGSWAGHCFRVGHFLLVFYTSEAIGEAGVGIIGKGRMVRRRFGARLVDAGLETAECLEVVGGMRMLLSLDLFSSLAVCLVFAF